MEQLVTKIEIQDIPGVFPEGYIDTYQSEFRVKAIPANIELNRIDWGIKNQFNVFGRKRKKYSLQAVVKESIFEGLQNLVTGNKITVTLENGDIHNAVLFAPFRSRLVRGTDFYNITMEYENKSSEELIYYALPRASDADLTTITLKNFKNDGVTAKDIPNSNWNSIIDINDALIFQSKLEPTLEIENINETSDNQTGTTKKRRTDISRNVLVRCYLNESDSNNLNLFLPLVSELEIEYNGDIYQAQEKVNPENIAKEYVGENFYSIEFTAKYNIIVYKHYRDE